MSKILWFGEKLAATGATAATFCSNTVATLLSYGSSTVATLNCTLHSRLSRLKTPFNSRFGSNGSSTSPNFAQEPHFPDSWELGDDYDEEDFDGWLSEEEWLDLMDDEEEEITSWQQRAVDEAIDEEQPGEHPANNDSSIGDIPW